MNVGNSPPLKQRTNAVCSFTPSRVEMEKEKQKEEKKKENREKQERGQGGGAAIQFVGRGTGRTRQGGPEVVVVKSCRGKRHKKGERERERKPQSSRDGLFTHVAVVERVASDCCLWRPSAPASLSVVERKTFVCYRPSGSSRVRRSNFPVKQSTSWQQLFS